MRTKPYTERGINRAPCCRCGGKSAYQWQCCAVSNKWMALCVECDIGLNRAALEYVRLPDVDKVVRSYAAAKRVMNNPMNSKRAKVARGESLTMKSRNGRDRINA